MNGGQVVLSLSRFRLRKLLTIADSLEKATGDFFLKLLENFPLRKVLADSKYRYCGLTRPWTLGSGGLLGGRPGGRAGRWWLKDSDVFSLQINIAGMMSMKRVDRVVLEPVRTYACTRTVRVTVPSPPFSEKVFYVGLAF